MTSVRASPTFARCAHLQGRDELLAALAAWSSVSPANSNVNTDPKPGLKYFLASSCEGCDGSEIERTEPSFTASWPLSHSAKAIRVLAVGLAAQRQRLQPLDELEGVEGRDAAAHVSESLDASQ